LRKGNLLLCPSPLGSNLEEVDANTFAFFTKEIDRLEEEKLR
jgi:hypothetical protein